MRALDLMYREKGDLVYFDVDDEEVAGALIDVEISDVVLMWYIDEQCNTAVIEFEYDDEVTVVQPFGRRD